MCMVYTNDGKRMFPELGVESTCLRDDERKKAFLSDQDNQYMSLKDGNWYQILGERSIIPICTIRPENVVKHKKRITEIFDEGLWSAIFGVFDANAKNALIGKITWLVALAIGGMVIWKVIDFFASKR